MPAIRRFHNLLLCAAFGAISFLPAQAQVNILTANGSNDRTNANLQEVQLTPSAVTPVSFGKLGYFPVDGQVYAQVLYVSGLAVPNQGMRNVAFVATMHNSVFAFDADTFSPQNPLWQVNLGPSVPSTIDISPEVGILSTGAIDLNLGVLYVVSKVLNYDGPAFYLHALDLRSGAERLNGPTVIAATVPGTGAGATSDNTLQFDPAQHLQRPGLLLANGSVYIAFGSHADLSPSHGWILSYDASDLSRQTGAFVSTPTGDAGSVWQSGRGLAADDTGNIYAITGNGAYDGIQNFAESILKLPASLGPPSDWFTPPNWQALSAGDGDLSAGPALVGGTHMVLAADKAGNLYFVNGDNMGGLSGAPGYPLVSPTSSGLTEGYVFNFAVWNQPDGAYLYIQPRTGSLECFSVAGNSLNGSALSSAALPAGTARIGLTISADGTTDGTGILWEITAGSDADTGVLHALDASNLARELWNSNMNPARDALGGPAKFVSPTVVNGKVYAPTFSSAVVVYGLLSGLDGAQQPQIDSILNAASYNPDFVSPGEVVAIFGTALGPAAPAAMQLDGSGQVAATLANTRVLFDGNPAPLLYVSATQLNAVVPFEIGTNAVQVQVESQGLWSSPLTIPAAPGSPGIFSVDGSGHGQGLIVNTDGTLNAPQNPAPAGSLVVFYVTGVGSLAPALSDGAVVQLENLPEPVLPVTVLIGGQPAPSAHVTGVPGSVAGLLQIQARIPSAVSGPALPVVLKIGNAASQPGLTVAVR